MHLHPPPQLLVSWPPSRGLVVVKRRSKIERIHRSCSARTCVNILDNHSSRRNRHCLRSRSGEFGIHPANASFGKSCTQLHVWIYASREPKSCLRGGGQVTHEDGAGEHFCNKQVETKWLGRLHKLITQRHLVQRGQKILVAVSGGQDSMCLLYLLSKLQSSWGWKLGIVHCDHQWTPSSRPQGSHVCQVASRLEIDYFQAVATYSVTGERAARTWRYGILQRIAISHGYAVIVTAHTASDRVETLLLNLFRGTGLHGLQSFVWKRWLSPVLCLSFQNGFVAERIIESVEDPSEGWRVIRQSRVALVRPFLDTSRTEVRSLCKSLGLPLWPDPSNYSLDIKRNRLRHQLLPYLRKHFQTGIDKSLLRLAEILHGDQQFLESLCEDIRMKVELPYHGQMPGKRLDIILLLSLPTALQRRVIKKFVESFTGKNLGFDHVERLRLRCLTSGERNYGKVSLPGSVELFFLDKELVLISNKPCV